MLSPMCPDHPSDPEPSFADLPSGPFAFTDEGSGPALVLVHGLPGSRRDFRWLVPCLTDHVRVIRLDLPGWGDTPLATERGTDLRARGGFVAAAVDALGLSSCALLGHSMGGAVAVAAADRLGDRLDALALLASAGMRRHRRMRRWGPGLVGFLLRTPLRRSLLGPLRRGFESARFPPLDDAQILHCMGSVVGTSWSAHAAAVRRLRAPTLVAWTDDDHLIEPPISEELAAACPPGPRLTFPTGGHNLQKSQAVELGQALGPWLTGLVAVEASPDELASTSP